VRRLAEGFARAGYLVIVPDLPGLMEDRITPKTVRETTQVAHEISTRSDAEDGKVALVGVSTGASLALLVAEDPTLKGKVSLVAGVAPFSNIRTVLSIATTRHYRREDGELVPYEANPFLSYVVARSLIAALPPGEDRWALSGELERVGRENPHPLSGVPSRDGVEHGAIASTKPWRLLAPLFMSSHLSLARSWTGCATSAQMTLLRRVGVGWLVVREGEPP
jgi:alpha-beta hydrolase superfamily lysophospholipase